MGELITHWEDLRAMAQDSPPKGGRPGWRKLAQKIVNADGKMKIDYHRSLLILSLIAQTSWL